MVTAPRQCDRTALRSLLDQSLSGLQESRLIAHLDTCPDCRGELETMAGGAEWWDDASQLLNIELDESDWSGEVGPEQTTYLGLSGDVPLADFNVDFLDPSDDPAMLGRLGDYDILEVIGRGGFGVVLKGYDAELNRHVAVKVLAPHLASSAAARRRFSREAQAAAAVVHPHVVAIHRVEAGAKLPYLVMPLVGGRSLQHRIDRAGPLDVPEILRIGLQTAQGLAAAHAQGLVHRDIKPANILLERDVDRVMITDFGLARAADDASLTRSGFVPGTPQYMSPEQARGEATEHRSDLFSLGTVLYAMCTGHPPFRAETVLGVLNRICESRHRPMREINAAIPEWLSILVDRLLEKDPSRRYPSAAALAGVLEPCLAHVQQPTVVALPEELRKARPSRRREKPSKSPRRPYWLAATVGSLATVLVLLLGLAAAQMSGLISGRADDPTNDPTNDPTTAPMIGVDDRRTSSLSDHDLDLADTRPIDPSPSPDVPPPSTPWFDATDRELERIDQDLWRLEREIETPRRLEK